MGAQAARERLLHFPGIFGRLLTSRRWLLLGMLVLLHLAMMGGLEDPLSRPLLVAHLGVFLLWQPIWHAELRVRAGATLLVAGAMLMILFALNWWLVALWLAILFGMVGGRVFGSRAVWLRLFYLGVMVYVLMLLLVWVVPQLVGSPVGDEFTLFIMRFLLPGLLVTMAFLPAEEEPGPGAGAVVDLLYSLILFMVVMVLVLGVFAIMTVARKPYLLAVVQMLFSLGGLLLLLGWLWNPRFGFMGLQQMFSSYLLNVGTPFEHWLSRIARAAELEKDPQDFMSFAARELASLPWIRFVAWRTPEGEGRIGQEGRHPVTLELGDLVLDLSTRYAPSPAMLLHMRLLALLVWRFYEAKRREKALRELTRLQAIYETGARLTHDVKNLLQSLYGLTSAAEHSDSEAYLQLLKRQLPTFTNRLEGALSKLHVPQPDAPSELVPAQSWWDNLKSRYEGRGIEFTDSIAGESRIPKSLFDSVAENLLDNARQKRLLEPQARVTVDFQAGEVAALVVCDSGTPVPDAVARVLFHSTVDSENGLGIGLYQCARLAERQGYQLRLRENQPGFVCFELSGRPSG